MGFSVLSVSQPTEQTMLHQDNHKSTHPTNILLVTVHHQFVNISQISELKKKLFGYETGPTMPRKSADSGAQTEEIER